jgi:cell division protein FtsZ
MAISSPLLEASIDGAHGVLLSIQGGSDLGLFEINEAAQLVANSAAVDANIIFGAVIDDALGDEVRVTVIAAGFDEQRPARTASAPAVQAPSGRAASAGPGSGIDSSLSANGATSASRVASGNGTSRGSATSSGGSVAPGSGASAGSRAASASDGGRSSVSSGNGAAGAGTSGGATAGTGRSGPAEAAPAAAQPAGAGHAPPLSFTPSASASGSGYAEPAADTPAARPADGTSRPGQADTDPGTGDRELAASSASDGSSGYVPAPVSFVSDDDEYGTKPGYGGGGDAAGGAGSGWKDSGRAGKQDKPFDVTAGRRRPVVFEEEDDLDVPDFLK